eukprot:gene18238-21822_t
MPCQFSWILPDRILFPSVVAVGSITMWTIQALLVGRAREKFNVKAPNVTGDEEFERILQSYQHTTEGLGAIIPSSFIFSYFICPKASLGLGLGWITSRILASCKWVNDKEKDCDGLKKAHCVIGHGSQFALLIGSIFGIGMTFCHRCRVIKSA